MHGLLTEHRPLPDKAYLARDIVEHIVKNGSYKRTAIVTGKPRQLLAEIQQEWQALLEQTKTQKANANDEELKEKLCWRIAFMQNRSFSADPPGEVLRADITLATAQSFLRFSPICQQIYIASDIKQEEAYMLTAWMFSDGKIIDYRKKEKGKYVKK